LYVLDGGRLNIPDTSPYRLKKEDLATTYMSVASFLVVHPKGTLMWDAGAVPESPELFSRKANRWKRREK
jgi:hypothetical protein